MSVMQDSPINNPDTYDKWTLWNRRNILTNLIQAEEHARYIDEDLMDPHHIACISKHLLSVRGELGELMTHTDNEKEQNRAEDVILKVEQKLERVQNGGNVVTIDEIKELRKELEPEMDVFDTSNCESCGELAELLRDDGTIESHMQTHEAMESDDDNEVIVEPVDEAVTHNQRRGGMSLSAALDPVVEFSQIPALLDEDPQRVASFWGVPFIAGLGDQSLELFTSELGQRVALGTGVVGSQLAIATGQTGGQLTDDLLMMSGVWTSGLFDSDPNEMQQLGQNVALFQEGVEELNFVKIIESLVDTGGSDQLVNDVQSALNGGGQQRRTRQNQRQQQSHSQQRQLTTTRQPSSPQTTVSTRTIEQSESSTTSSSSSSGSSGGSGFDDDSAGAGFEDDSSGFNAGQDPF